MAVIGVAINVSWLLQMLHRGDVAMGSCGYYAVAIITVAIICMAIMAWKALPFLASTSTAMHYESLHLRTLVRVFS